MNYNFVGIESDTLYVVYCVETGNEIETFTDDEDAREFKREMNANDDWGYTYRIREEFC